MNTDVQEFWIQVHTPNEAPPWRDYQAFHSLAAAQTIASKNIPNLRGEYLRIVRRRVTVVETVCPITLGAVLYA